MLSPQPKRDYKQMRNKIDQVDKGVGMPADVAAIDRPASAILSCGSGLCSRGRCLQRKVRFAKRILVVQGTGIFAL